MLHRTIGSITCTKIIILIILYIRTRVNGFSYVKFQKCCCCSSCPATRSCFLPSLRSSMRAHLISRPLGDFI